MELSDEKTLEYAESVLKDLYETPNSKDMAKSDFMGKVPEEYRHKTDLFLIQKKLCENDTLQHGNGRVSTQVFKLTDFAITVMSEHGSYAKYLLDKDAEINKYNRRNAMNTIGLWVGIGVSACVGCISIYQGCSQSQKFEKQLKDRPTKTEVDNLVSSYKAPVDSLTLEIENVKAALDSSLHVLSLKSATKHHNEESK